MKQGGSGGDGSVRGQRLGTVTKRGGNRRVETLRRPPERDARGDVEAKNRVFNVSRDGNQGPGPRAWTAGLARKACCGAGLGLHLVSPKNCGPRGTGSKRDG
ncbi:hypothetical protein YC2023_070745 [Brassica napus]